MKNKVINKSTMLDLEKHKIESIYNWLSVPDTVEACSTIPGWDFILTQPQYIMAIRTHIKRF